MALSPALGNKEQCEDATGESPLPVLLPREWAWGLQWGRQRLSYIGLGSRWLPTSTQALLKSHIEKAVKLRSPLKQPGADRAFQTTNSQRWGRGPDPLGLESLFPVPQPDS